MSIYISSDYHLGHLLMAQQRKFETPSEMNDYIIQQHNSVVNKNSIFYFLGDLSFTNPTETRNLLSAMNGKKYWILGNHDKQPYQYSTYFESINHYELLKYNKHRFILFHYPISSWHGMHKQSIHLHGHSHGKHKYSYPLTKEYGMRIDISFDVWNAPVDLDQIIQMKNSFTFKSLDHHE